MTIQTSNYAVEVRNVTTGTSSVHCLAGSGAGIALKNSKIVFFTGSNKFDIYDTATNTWSIGLLPVVIERASIISVNNSIYVAGGSVNGVLSDKVWKLEF